MPADDEYEEEAIESSEDEEAVFVPRGRSRAPVPEESESSEDDMPLGRSRSSNRRSTEAPRVISQRRSRLQSPPKEEIRFPRDHREQKSWTNYVQLHSEFKDLSNYSVIVELNQYDVKRLKQPQQVLSEMDLKRYRPVVIHPQSEEFRFFDTKHGFDIEVAESLGYLDKLNEEKSQWVLGQQDKLDHKAEKHVKNLAKEDYRYVRDWNRLLDYKKRKYLIDDIYERIHNGAILFLSNENATKLQEHLDQAELFRKTVVRYLPEFTVEALLLISSHKRVSERYGEVKYNDLIPITIFTDDQHKTELQIYSKVYKIVSNRLASRYRDGILMRTSTEHPERRKNKFYIRNRVHVRYIAIPRPDMKLVEQDKERLAKKAYEFAQRYGDFSLISREDKKHKVDSSKLRVVSPVIHRQLTTQLGSSNRFFYRTDVSDQALSIFIRGIYDQNFESQLTAQLLPELYNLFFELECQQQVIGLVLNEYLATQIDHFEDPEDFIESLYEQCIDDPELRLFNAQILRMRNELSGKNPFTVEDYRAFIHKEILPKFQKNFSDYGDSRVRTLQLTFDRDELLKKLKRDYIGIRKPKDAYFEFFVDQIETHLAEVIRQDWPEYPLDEVIKSRGTYGELQYELIPLYRDLDNPDFDYD
jgi:hypothetical protein